MVATNLDGRGGVAAVLRTWRDQGLFERRGVRFVATNGEGGRVRKALLAVTAWLRCLGHLCSPEVRLIHVHTSSYASFWRKSPVLAMAAALRRPFIVSLHGGAFAEFYAGSSGPGQAWIRWTMRRALAYVVLTDSWRRWVESVEPRARVVVIPNAVPELPQIDELGAGPDADADSVPMLLFLGRIEHAKGIDLLISALAMAHARGAPWRLTCGGAGDVAGAKAAMAAQGVPAQAVEFKGWVDGETKRALLRSCSLLVLPSRIENMPVVLLEAFAWGKPVIATAVGGVPNMVADGIDGWLVPPGDPQALAATLIDAFARRDEWHAMGRAARMKAELRYAPALVVAQVEDLYDRCRTPRASTQGEVR